MTAITARTKKQSWWPLVKRIVSLAIVGAVVAVLFVEARHINWVQVREALSATPAKTLGIAAALGIASHLLFSTFDLAGRLYVRSRLPIPLVMAVNFVSYAFNLSFGTIVGGLGMRYRLYTNLGVKMGDVTRIISLSIITNWVGHILLAGLFLVWLPLPLPQEWAPSPWLLRAIGVLLTAAAIGYVALCAFSRRREWNIRGRRIALPSVAMALVQVATSCVNWLLMCALVYALIDDGVTFAAVTFTLLVAAVAGVLTHLPAGLGVTEGVFIAMLGHLAPKEELLAALLLYRVIYYLVPLALAAVAYAMLEMRAKTAAT